MTAPRCGRSCGSRSVHSGRRRPVRWLPSRSVPATPRAPVADQISAVTGAERLQQLDRADWDTVIGGFSLGECLAVHTENPADGPYSPENHRTTPNPTTPRDSYAALYRTVIVRMQYHAPTKTYVARRTAEGKTKSEIIRCLKRLLARELWAAMRPFREAARTLPATA